MASSEGESDSSVSDASQSLHEEEKKCLQKPHEINERRRQPRRRKSGLDIANLVPESLRIQQGHDDDDVEDIANIRFYSSNKDTTPVKNMELNEFKKFSQLE